MPPRSRVNKFINKKCSAIELTFSPLSTNATITMTKTQYIFSKILSYIQKDSVSNL